MKTKKMGLLLAGMQQMFATHRISSTKIWSVQHLAKKEQWKWTIRSTSNHNRRLSPTASSKATLKIALPIWKSAKSLISKLLSKNVSSRRWCCTKIHILMKMASSSKRGGACGDSSTTPSRNIQSLKGWNRWSEIHPSTEIPWSNKKNVNLLRNGSSKKGSRLKRQSANRENYRIKRKTYVKTQDLILKTKSARPYRWVWQG